SDGLPGGEGPTVAVSKEADMELDTAAGARARTTGQLILGFAIIFGGLLLLLQNFDVPVPHLSPLWPLILVAFGAARIRRHGARGFFWGFALIAAGILYLLENFHRLPFHVFDLWPILLVAIGARIALRGVAGPRLEAPVVEIGTSPSVLSESAAFGG